MRRTLRTPWISFGLLVGAAMVLSGCIKPTTFNPYANPGRHELDRLQKIVNQRPDLEPVQHQLAELDRVIRAAIAKYSPRTKFSTLHAESPSNGCGEPFDRTIGAQEHSAMFSGRPAPTAEQWLQITTELEPAFAAAGFHQNDLLPGQPPRPLGSPNDSQRRDDGALINLVNLGVGRPLDYSYSTGCHLPADWRTAPPPRKLRPAGDPDVRYPYLYGSPGGRTRDVP